MSAYLCVFMWAAKGAITTYEDKEQCKYFFFVFIEFSFTSLKLILPYLFEGVYDDKRLFFTFKNSYRVQNIVIEIVKIFRGLYGLYLFLSI